MKDQQDWLKLSRLAIVLGRMCLEDGDEEPYHEVEGLRAFGMELDHVPSAFVILHKQTMDDWPPLPSLVVAVVFSHAWHACCQRIERASSKSHQ